MEGTAPQLPERWAASIIAIHWATVACVVVLLITGWQLSTHAAHLGQRAALLQWHASLGVALLAVTVLRVLARLLVRRPSSPTESGLHRASAYAIQVALYLLLLALVVTGIAAAAPRPFAPAVQLFGSWPLPKIVGIPPTMMRTLPAIHATLVWCLLGLVSLHVMAATYGTLVRRDRTLFRMVPWLPRGWKKPIDAPNHDSLPSPNGRSQRGISVARAVAITVLITFLGLAGALISIPFWVNEGARQVSSDVPLNFRRGIGNTSIAGTLAINDRLSFRLLIDVDAGVANLVERSPEIVIDMLDHPMAPLRPAVGRSSNRQFSANGSLPMPGRWRLRLVFPAGSAEVPFTVPARER